MSLPAPLRRLISICVIPSYRAFSRLRNGSRTIGAAAVVVNDRDEITMVKLSYRSGWGLPGGFGKRREIPHRTAEREAKEETGLDLDLSKHPSTVVLDNYHAHLTFVFRASSSQVPHRPKGFLKRKEILEVCQIPIDQLSETYLHKGTRELLKATGITLPPHSPELAG